MILKTNFSRMLLIVFITFVSVSIAQPVILNETDSELIEESELVIDTISNTVLDSTENIYPSEQSKYRIGIELKHPFIHGGDDEIPDFWNERWRGIFGLSADFRTDC